MNVTRRRIAILFVSIFGALNVQSIATAALTFIGDSPDQHDEPNLTGINPFPNNLNPSVLETLYGENNLRRVDDSFDFAFQHTGEQATVKAVARFNNPSIEERFRYFNIGNGSSQTVLQFERVPPNFLYPVGYNPLTRLSGVIPLADSGPVFEVGVSSRTWSNSAKNDFGQDQMVTFEIVGTDGHSNNQIGNYVLAWEYFPADDLDFQDVVFEISGVRPVPEPTASLTAVVSALILLPLVRRSRSLQCAR